MAKYMKTEDGYQKIEVINANKMNMNNPVGTGSFSMGRKAGTTVGPNSHAEGSNTAAPGPNSHAEGSNTAAPGPNSHAEGSNTAAPGPNSHAEGSNTAASGSNSHAEGSNTAASGSNSHAEGSRTTASGSNSHAEGSNTTASGWYSHAEGSDTTASGPNSHAEGGGTTASGYASHAEGGGTTASGYASHAEGGDTVASTLNQHVSGSCNILDPSLEGPEFRGRYIHIVGNGLNKNSRSNAHTLDWNGNAWFAGDVYVGSTSGTNKDDGSKKLATEDYVNNNVDTTLTKSGQAADAAAVGEQLSSLSGKIVTTAESKVSEHNTGADTHSDIRLLISGLTDRLNALADSDDTTLDQLSEVVAYIKSNRTLIEAITTSKVSVADIIDNLTTNVSNKPLSAAQGVALKALIDAISIPDKLPNPNALTFTGAVSGSYDGSTPLKVVIPSGGGSGGNWKQAGFVQSETDGETLEVTGMDTKSVRLLVCAAAYASDTNNKAASIKINGSINLTYSGFIPLTTAKITVIEIYLITTTGGNYIFAPNFPTMRVADTTAMSALYQVGNYSAWFLTRADTAEKIESISFACGNGTLLAGSKINVEVM